jgi:EAL and modified HD-GYP domain-containing signal transduction protein
LADIVFIDVLGKSEAELARLVQAARAFVTTLIAKRVEDRAILDLAKRLGLALFQGFYFQKPETITCRKLSSIQVSRLKLLRLIEEPELDMQEIGAVIQADVSLSYRLLGFLNSAFFAFPQKIRSIPQALVLLGWKQLKNWLRLIILTDLTPERTSEIPLHSVQRARFLESVAERHRSADRDAGALFLLGLFSLLDALLEIPMPEVVDELPLAQELKAALCGEPNDYADWLALAEAFERAEWGRIEGLIARLELIPVEVAVAYSEALEWADKLFRDIA